MCSEKIIIFSLHSMRPRWPTSYAAYVALRYHCTNVNNGSAAQQQQLQYVFALSVQASVWWHRYLVRFARILNGFRWNLREVITTTSTTTNKLRLHFGRSWNSDTKGAWYDRIFESTSIGVATYDVKQVLTPSEWIYKFHCANKRMRSRTQFHVNLKTSLTNFI